MRLNVRRAAAIVAGLTMLSAAATGVSRADNTVPDGDDTSPVAANGLDFGTVCVNSSTDANSLVAISRNGSATGTNTFRSGATVTVTVLSVSGSGMSASMDPSPATIVLPSDWGTLGNNTMSDTVSSKVTFAAGGTAGAVPGSVTFRASGLNSDGASITRDASMTVSATVSDTGACAPTPSDSTPPNVTVSLPSPVSGSNGWFNAADVTPVVGTVTASDSSNITNISCDGGSVSDVTGYGTTSASGTLTVSGDGSHAVVCTATDGADNTGAASGSANTATVNIDTAAPAVTPDNLVDGTWRNASLSQAFTASDETSGLATPTDGDPGFTVTASAESADSSTPTVATYTVYDVAGNSTVASVSAMIDLHGPTITDNGPTEAPDGDNGWYVSPVTENFAASDALSGLADCSSTFTKDSGTTEGSAVQVASGSCSDNAGNTSPSIDSTDSYKIDLSDPYDITWTGGPSDGGSYYFGSVPAAPTCDATDDVSGLASCNVTGYSSAVGAHTLTATATDNAGNTATETRTYTVLSWTFSGFYQPVDMGGVINTIKGGSTVPIKFELFVGQTELTDTADVVTPLKYQTINCDSSEIQDSVETVSTGATSLRYDTTGGQFIYNWQTPKTSGKCYSVTISALDGSSRTALFKTK